MNVKSTTWCGEARLRPHGRGDHSYGLTAERTNLKRIDRRVTEEHRLVYLVDGDDLVILQARFHYK